MAPPTRTVGSLVADVSEIVANTATPQDSYKAQIKGALNAALMEWANKCRPAPLHKQNTLATIVGTTDYDLADDFGLMVDTGGVWCAATPFTVLQYRTFQEWTAAGMHNTDSSSDPPTAYCLPESNVSTGAQVIRFWPKPSAIRTIAYRYVRMPAAIDTADDGTNMDIRIPYNLLHGFVWGAVANLPGLLADPQRLGFYEGRWRQFLSDTKAQTNRIIGTVRQRARYDRPFGGEIPMPNPTIGGTGY
jgi:hypothetical protein